MSTPTIPAQTLLGNPERQFMAVSGYELNLDIVFQNGVEGVPTQPPYPFPAVAGPYAPAVWAANYQCWIDYEGVVQPILYYMQNNKGQVPPPSMLQHFATWSGDAFFFQGVIYSPGKWSPF